MSPCVDLDILLKAVFDFCFSGSLASLPTAANVNACMAYHLWTTSVQLSYIQTSQSQRQQLILFTFLYLQTLALHVPVAWSDHSIVGPYIVTNVRPFHS